jgi:hypothetical protein
MSRPVGVTIIAIFEFLGAAFLLLIGILAIAGGGILASVMSQSQNAGAGGMGGIMAFIGGAISIFCFIFAVICALIGWGLLKLKGWARILVIVFSALGVILGLLGLLGAFAHPALLVGVVIRLAINGLILWYMLTPDVKAAFARS